jgi:myo-inositol-1(or 4)-monophosphatase
LAAEACTSRFPADARAAPGSSGAAGLCDDRRTWVAAIFPDRASPGPEACVCVALVAGGVTEVAATVMLEDGSVIHARRGASAASGTPRTTMPQTHLAAGMVAVCRGELAAEEGRAKGRVLGLLPVETIAHGLALVAMGRVQAAYTTRELEAVEICAGSLLVEEAGGVVTDRLARPLVFLAGRPRLSGVIAASAALWGQLFDLLGEDRPS